MIKIESIMTQNKQVLYLVKKEIKSLTAFHKRNGQLGNSRKKNSQRGLYGIYQGSLIQEIASAISKG